MDYRQETEEEHRQRDAQTWDTILWMGFFFKGLRYWILLLLILVGAAWIMNILGESTILNSPDIMYSGRDRVTGKMVVVKGCRPEMLLPDGTCDKAITLELVRKAFPHFGPPQTVESK